MVIIAANAGGAWSPLGDVTTTMLWIRRANIALNIMKTLILPSLAVVIIPALILIIRFRGQTFSRVQQNDTSTAKEKRDGKIILYLGIGLLIFVPVFKTITHLPPMGMLLALGMIWVAIAVP